MAFKGFWAKIGNWRKNSNDNSDGDSSVAVKKKQGTDMQLSRVEPEKKDPLAKINQGFEKLVTELEGIRTNLQSQVETQKNFMDRINELPDMLKTIPESADRQVKLAEKIEQTLKTMNDQQKDFSESVDRIPEKVTEQTESLNEICTQLKDSAGSQKQMNEKFGSFTSAVSKLEQSTSSQTDSILQLSKTFSTSDRYLKHVISKQSSRFLWLYIVTAFIAVLAITGLATCTYLLYTQ